MRAPEGVLTEELRREVADAKDALLALLARAGTEPGVARPRLRPTGWTDGSPLSPGQERLWRLQERAPDSAALHIAAAHRIRGSLEVAALREALSDVTARHASLRASIVSDEGEPRMRVAAPGPVAFRQSDLGGGGGDPEAHLRRILHQEARTPFRLSVGPLIRFLLVRVGVEDHVLLLTTHHIVSDGLSLEIFFGDLAEAYEARVQGRRSALRPLAIDYPDFVSWQRALLAGERMDELRAYWEGRFAGEVPALRLPASPGGHGQGYQGGRVQLRLDPGLERGIDALCAAHNATPFMVLLSAHLVVLQGISGQDDLVVCAPSAGRSEPELSGLIGYFNNLLGLRVSLAGQPTFVELLDRVRNAVLGAFAHEDFPFQELASFPNLARVPLTRAMFALNDAPPPTLSLTGLSVERISLEPGSANFDVSLSIELDGADRIAVLAHKASVGDESFARALLEDLSRVLAAVSVDPTLPLADLVASGPGIAVPESTPKRRVLPPWLEPGADPADLPVRDALELQLTLIWERVLDVRPIAPEDDFFDLGGHSLLAVQLLEEIEAELGAALPLATFFEVTTVAAMTRILRDEGWEPPDAPVITLQPDGTGAPLFVVHSYEGHVFLFHELSRRLAPDHPVYGIQAVGLDGSEPPIPTVEAMADHYLPHIRAAQPAGPYTFLAMCFGFAVGLELAQRLQAEGEEVTLVLLDGGFDRLVPDVASVQAEWGRSVEPGLVPMVTRRVRGLRDRIAAAIRSIRATSFARRDLRMRNIHAAAWMRYQPNPYCGHVVLVRCSETAANPLRAWHLQALERLAMDRSSVVTVEGDHFSILRAPHVEGLADAVRACLASDRERGTPPPEGD